MPEQEGAVQEPHERVGKQVLAVTLAHRGPLRFARLGEEPEYMAPPAAVVWRVRIARPVAELMMLAMHGNPSDRRPFARQCPQKPKRAPHERVGLEAAVREQPMIAQANPKPAGDPGQHDQGHESLPGENKGRRQGCDMDQADPEHYGPIQPVGPTPSEIARRGVCHWSGFNFKKACHKSPLAQQIVKRS